MRWFVLALWLAGCAAPLITETKFTDPELFDAGVVTIGRWGKWFVGQGADPIDDTPKIGAFLPSEDWVPNQSGAVLKMVCIGGEAGFEAQIGLYGVRVAYNDEPGLFSDVIWRLDKQKAVSEEWAVADDQKALLAWPVARIRALPDIQDVQVSDEALKIRFLQVAEEGQVQWAKDVLGHTQLVVRIRPSGDGRSEKDFVFDLRGASRAVAPVLDACGW